MIYAFWGYATSTASCCSSSWFGAQTSDYFTQLSHFIDYSSSSPLPLTPNALYVLHADPCTTDLYCITEQRQWFVFISRAELDLNASPLWPHPYDCILTPLSWSDLDFDKLLSGGEELLFGSVVVEWIKNAASPDWPQSTFSTLTLSFRSHHCFTYLQSYNKSGDKWLQHTRSGTFGRWR